MKRRWPVYLAMMGAVALAAAWAVRPEESGLPPEIAKELTLQNQMPKAGFSGPPPPGAVWEVYVLPLPYARVTEAMKSAPEWKGQSGERFPGIPKITYRSIKAGPQAQVEVMPGRLFIYNSRSNFVGRERPENYTVVMVATPSEPSFRTRALARVDRLLGRKPPTLPSGAFVAYQYPREYQEAARIQIPAQTPKVSSARGGAQP